jgi:hypothetical protein
MTDIFLPMHFSWHGTKAKGKGRSVTYTL